MKIIRTILILLPALVLGACSSTPQLKENNIDKVIKVMTDEEKAHLIVCANNLNTTLDSTYAPMIAACKDMVPGCGGFTYPIARLGIPSLVLADGPAGLRISPVREGTDSTFYCTGFPIGTSLSATWDPQVARDVAEAIGEELVDYGVDVLLAPGQNLHRNPLCGRNFEYFSEDPLLSGKMASAYVKGIQKNDVGVSVKHYAVNNQETNRNEDNARVSERALREIYLKNFEIAIKESAPWTVMSSYNQLNGEYTQQKKDLLTTILRDEWGYNGIVMTDWGSKAGTVKSAWSGNDLMEPGNQNEIDRIVAGVQDGSLAIEDVDRNVRNMLNYIVKTPAFKNYKYSNKPDLAGHAQVARKAAAEAMVLLRNEDNTLPVASGKKVALFGISSLDFVAGGTGSGNVNKAYVVNMKEGLENAGFTVDQALMNFYQAQLDYNRAVAALTSAGGRGFGFGSAKAAEVAIPEAAVNNEARNNDLAIVVIGRNAGEGADRRMVDDFDLTNIERELLRNVSTAFHAAGKKVIVVLNIGGVIETNSWKNMVDAILLPWSPGQEGANAVADILTGKANPSGRLPMTFPINFMDHPSSANFPYNYDRNAGNQGRGPQQPRKDVDYTNYEEGIYVGYRYFATAGKEVSYPFGYGLSYTTFSYTKPVVKAVADGFEATVTVTNTGSVAGKEVVELYVSAPAGGLEKPACELKGFAKTRELKPGESQTVTIKVTNYELASFNEAASAWEAAAGTYKVAFGSSVADIRANATYQLKKAASWKTNKLFALDAPLNELSLK